MTKSNPNNFAGRKFVELNALYCEQRIEQYRDLGTLQDDAYSAQTLFCVILAPVVLYDILGLRHRIQYPYIHNVYTCVTL